MEKNKLKLATSHFVVIFAFILTSCSTPVHKEASWNHKDYDRSVATDAGVVLPLVQTLPKLTEDKNNELKEGLKKALKNRTKGLAPDQLNAAAEKLRNYLLFLGLTAKDLKKAESKILEPAIEATAPVVVKSAGDDGDSGGEDEDDKTPSNLKAIQRLFIASTQFLDCSSMTDWICLEKTPVFKPTADFRIERADLSTPVKAGESLDMDVYFTNAWDGSPSGNVADRFAEKISDDGDKTLSLAMYGIDDIEGSMKGVYEAIIERAKNNETKVRAVVDVMGFERGKNGPWVFNYVPQPEPKASQWVFGSSLNPETPNAMHMTFQYDGTPNFIRDMNEGIKSQDESRARIEWSTARIMHNKFAVMENEEGEKSVWTGTANISKNCMGLEANANMSVYIKNNHIAEAFQEQFNLMFDFDKSIKVKSKLVTEASPADPSIAGRFHRGKYPVNKRLFQFEDGTNVRVHFAPTDDAEHRVIIPMLMSAKAGDEIRISMFGGTGFEIVRAMQYAVAKGASIKIAFDRRLGHGLTSWIRDAILNVHMPNPYINKFENVGVKPGSISVRVTSLPHWSPDSDCRPAASRASRSFIVGHSLKGVS